VRSDRDVNIQINEHLQNEYNNNNNDDDDDDDDNKNEDDDYFDGDDDDNDDSGDVVRSDRDVHIQINEHL
jgi:hypothetical protein